MYKLKILLFLLVAAIIVPNGVMAEEATQSEHSSEFEGRQSVAFFMGNTHDGSEDGFTVRMDYEYRLSETNGIGGLVEYASGELDSWVFAAPLFIHPYKGLRLLVALGFEYGHSEAEFLIRTGIAYEFEMGERWTIIPEFDIDFVDSEEKYVYGIAFGYEF
jgi:hypothetical protein